MEEELVVSKNTFRNYYNRRAIVYGPSAGLTGDKRYVDDIFGLGMLFYCGNEGKGDKKFPIQIYDTKIGSAINKEGRAEDNTNVNSSTDLWNAYKHGSYFVDKDFIKKAKKDEEGDNVEELGNQKYTMAYGPAVLKNRAEKAAKAGVGLFKKNQLVASEAVFEANGIDRKWSTSLERTLWEVNSDIYTDVMDYFDSSPSDTCDFTDIVMLASISTFRFNNKFGQYFGLNDNIKFDGSSNGYILKLSDKVKPISFDKEKLDMDVIMKAIYAGDKEVKEEYDMMYYLGMDTFGVVSAIILIVAEIFIVAYVITRMVHLVVVYLLSTVVCAFSYGCKREFSNKAWLGTLVQAVYFLAAHAVLIFMLNLSVCNDMPRNGWTSLLFSLLILLGAGFSMAIELKVMMFLITNIRDLGGQIAADKLNAMASKIKGVFEGNLNGDVKARDIKVNGDNVQSYGNDDDDEVKRNRAGSNELADIVEQADKVRGAGTKFDKSLGGKGTDNGDVVRSPIDDISSPGGSRTVRGDADSQRGNIYNSLNIDSTKISNKVNNKTNVVNNFETNSFESNSIDGSSSFIDNSSSYVNSDVIDVQSADLGDGTNIRND